jgi:hypothetical protein
VGIPGIIWESQRTLVGSGLGDLHQVHKNQNNKAPNTAIAAKLFSHEFKVIFFFHKKLVL